MINLTNKTSLKGRYKLEAVRADGSIRPLTGWFDNIITNNGLDLIGQGNTWSQYCSVGSGNATPTVTDTTLQTFVAQTSTHLSNAQAATASPPYYGYSTIVFQFGIGVATGNLSEVGIGNAGGGTSLFSRALILDGFSNPTTITVLPGEALNVTYQLQLYSPSVDVTGTINISGTNYNYTQRAAQVTSSQWAPSPNGGKGGFQACNAYSGAIGAVTAAPSGFMAGASSVTNGSYTNGSYSCSATVVYNLATGNGSGGSSYTAGNVLSASNANLGGSGSGFSITVGTVASGAILTYTTLVGGSGYVDGTYLNVPLTGGSGFSAFAKIVVSGGAVTAVTQGGIRSFLLTCDQYYASLGYFQIDLGDVLPKDSTKTLTLSFTQTWARYP